MALYQSPEHCSVIPRGQAQFTVKRRKSEEIFFKFCSGQAPKDRA